MNHPALRSYRQRLVWLFLLLLTPGAVDGADYFVSPKGDDAHEGTLENPWASLTRAGEALQPGDTLYLRGGEYRGQQLRPTRSGTDAQPIRYVAYANEQPVLTAVKIAIDLSERSHIHLDGIHVNGGGEYRDATVEWWLRLDNSHSNTVQNCHFQYARGWSGVRVDGGSRFNRILNNRMDCVGSWDMTNNSVGGQRTLYGRIPASQGGGNDTGDLFDIRDASSNLIEGNHLSRGGHSLLTCYGDRNVIRDNRFENRWSESEDPDHVYGRGAKGNRNGSLTGKNEQQAERNLYEGNFVVFSYPASDQPLQTGAIKVESVGQICRRNVFYRNQGIGITTTARAGVPDTRGNRIYHNTFFDNGGPAWRVEQNKSGGFVDTSVFKNNIVYRNRQSPPVPEHDVDVFMNVLRNHQVVSNSFAKAVPGDARFWIEEHGSRSVRWYEQMFPANFRGNLDAVAEFAVTQPTRFEDFALAGGAAQIDAGEFLTKTRGAGEGAVLPVEDAGYFCDGFEIVDGDVVQLEHSRERVRIVRVDYEKNLLHLERPVRWKDGQGITLAYEGRAPDIGAFEHGF